MCNKCDDFDNQAFGFEGSDAEREAFHEWLHYNADGTLTDFRDSDHWAQAFCDAEVAFD